MRPVPSSSSFAHLGVCRRSLVVALAASVSGLALAAAPALGESPLKEDFAPFADCPVESAVTCLVSSTTGGEFVLHRKKVPVEKTITLQGGLATESFESQPLLAAVGGETLSNTPLKVPGGLLGIEGLGAEVTATAEIAGPPSAITIDRKNLLILKETAVTLPLKIKLENPTLGSHCYIGTESNPIVLHLTTGSTSPPAPFESIKGSFGVSEGRAKGKIRFLNGTSLVDNDFAVPGVTGCGGLLSFVIDPLVDLIVGVPAQPGASTAIMSGSLEETTAELAAKYKPKPKK